MKTSEKAVITIDYIIKNNFYGPFGQIEELRRVIEIYNEYIFIERKMKILHANANNERREIVKKYLSNYTLGSILGTKKNVKLIMELEENLNVSRERYEEYRKIMEEKEIWR